MAYIQLRSDQRTSPEELLRYAQSSIPERAAWPKEIKIVSALPTTPVGKISKPALMLREMEALVAQVRLRPAAQLSATPKRRKMRTTA